MNQAFFKLEKGKFIQLTDSEQEFFNAANVTLKIIKDSDTTYDGKKYNELIISFKKDSDGENINVYLWSGDQSIGLTLDEFLVIYDFVKDKDRLIQAISAQLI